MTNKVCFFLFFAVLSMPLRVSAQAIDSIKVRTLYETRKREFSDFRKLHGHFFSTRNVKMHYLTWGKPGSKTLIWSHGTNSNAFELADLADSLVTMGYYVVAIDYYGHGFTPIPSHEVSLYHVADDIHELMDTLKIRKAVLGGWSRGGAISTAFYDAYPGRVAGLILEDGGSVPWSADDHQKPADTLRRQIAENYKTRDAEPEFDSEIACFFHECRKYLADRHLSQRRAPFFTFFARVKQTPKGKWVADPGLAEFVCVRTEEQMLALKQRTLGADNLFCISNEQLNPIIIYRNLSVPMLIFDPVYTNDDLDFEEENRKLQAMHPGLVIHRVYKDTRHDVKLHRPGEFMADLRRFLTVQVSKIGTK
jgi:pimeloyl-ACP methyl ester carboxylesterase